MNVRPLERTQRSTLYDGRSSSKLNATWELDLDYVTCARFAQFVVERALEHVVYDTWATERMTLEGDPTHGVLRIAGRSSGAGPTRIDVFAIDPEDDGGVYVGAELVDVGTSVAGFTLVESRPPRLWTAPF